MPPATTTQCNNADCDADALNNEDYANNGKSNANKDDNDDDNKTMGGGWLRKTAAIDAAATLTVGLMRSSLIKGLPSSPIACLQ
jgi:hypothetical protein